MSEHKIIISGFGGQGVVLTGNILATAALIENKHTISLISYGVEVRGGTANSSTIISDDEISSPVIEKPDIVIALNQPSLDKYKAKVEKGGYIILNTSLAEEQAVDGLNVISLKASDIASGIGNIKAANIVALGALLSRSRLLDPESVTKAIEEVFSSRPNLIGLNKKALESGMKNV